MLLIQRIVDSVEVPSSVGRIPAIIASGFTDFTADQRKSWILIYSLIALRNIIPDADYACWTTFVDGCVLLCSQTLTLSAISQAHDLIVQYCQAFLELYGKSACTINMHLACHMADCIWGLGQCIHSGALVLMNERTTWSHTHKQSFN